MGTQKRRHVTVSEFFANANIPPDQHAAARAKIESWASEGKALETGKNEAGETTHDVSGLRFCTREFRGNPSPPDGYVDVVDAAKMAGVPRKMMFHIIRKGGNRLDVLQRSKYRKYINRNDIQAALSFLPAPRPKKSEEDQKVDAQKVDILREIRDTQASIDYRLAAIGFRLEAIDSRLTAIEDFLTKSKKEGES